MNAWLFPLALASLALPALDGLLPDAGGLRTPGGTVRLVADGPDEDGAVRGAVVFELDPGWKTYWRDPGAAGLAPAFRFTANGRETRAEMGFPAPIRFEEGGEPVNGYDRPVAIAFTIEEGARGTLDLDLAAGICLDLCVPVFARLAADLSAPASAADRTVIERAFLALPEDDDVVLRARVDETELVVERPEGASRTTDLFVAGAGEWSFGPTRAEGSAWRVRIRSRPDLREAATSTFDAVITDGGRGQSIRIALF